MTAATPTPGPTCVCGIPGLDYDGPLAMCDVHGQPSVAYEQGKADAYMEMRVQAAFEAVPGLAEFTDAQHREARATCLSCQNGVTAPHRYHGTF